MLLKIFTLACIFLIKLFIQPTICAAPNVQNLELDDVTSLWDKFPSIIDKIKEAVSRFRCPKGWKRLGGSCYYFSNFTSISSHANYTCNHFHSNLSNIMQIRNAVELFYAAHVLSRNNLSSLMIEIDLNLLQGKNISNMLMNDQGQWKRMKEKLREVRIKYDKLKQKIVDRLNAAGLRILRRSKKLKPVPPKQEIIHDEIDFDQSDDYDEDYDRESKNTTTDISSIINNDEYEYDDLDSSEESDEFEQIENIRSFCDEIHWNVLNNTNNATVYILTKYNMSDKIVCSLSDIDPHTKYHHVCEYVLDFCFANILCGKHGVCVNTLTGFKCSCSFLYGGLLCEKITENGIQILSSIVIIFILFTLSIKPVRIVLWFFVERIINYCKKHRKARKAKKVGINDDTQRLVASTGPDNDEKITELFHQQQRRQTIAQDIMQFFYRNISNPLISPVKRNLVRNIWVGALSVFLLTILFVITTVMYYISFGYNFTDDEENVSINDTIRLVRDCARISDYRIGNLIFAPGACVLILLFSWSVKRENQCLETCDGRPGLIPPIEPFHTANRFTTATVFGILAFEVLKIFEELLFSTGQPLEHGVLIELLLRIALVIVVGLRYYPVLASLQLRNIVARFFACLYIICNIIYTIVREGSCMGFLVLSGQYTALEEAKLRRELGTWFIVYGLIKNIPHFFFLSYIGAELCVRFAYDSIYVPRKKNKSIWSAPIVQLDESEFAKYYVTKLFRRNRCRTQIHIEQSPNIDNLVDYEHEAQVELQNEANPSFFQKLIGHFYHFDDDFRFTTMAMCTYTVAIVFLYYLACTFVFLYIARTTGHGAFLKFYFESTFNVDLGTFSLKTEIIVSAVFTALIYGGQLFIGMQNYKKHKLRLYKGICIDIPPAHNFDPGSIASNSVHYSGFLVGYMAWGFVICFHLILLILIGIRIISLQIRHIEIVLSIVVPILIIYLLKMLSMTSAGKFLFIQEADDNKLNLRSRKTYALFIYFSFFADCFLGIASCIIRLIKATCLNIVYMARLDSSFMGRPLERFDRGFAAYASYLHMEVTYTNPVMLAFCYSLYDDIVKRRAKHCYDDECCIAASELDDDNDIEAPRQNQVQQNRTSSSQNMSKVTYRRTDINNPNGDESRSERTSQIEIKLHSQEHPTVETTSETDSQNLSTVSTREKPEKINRKIKQQQITTSTTARNIPQQQQTIFSPGPEVPRREDLSSGQDGIDDDDDSGDLKPKSSSTVEKLVPEPQPRLNSSIQSSKINTDNRVIEDEDGGISKQKESTKKKNLKKRKKGGSKSNTSQEEDDGSGHIVSSYDTSKTIISSKPPKLDIRKAIDDSSSDNTNDNTTQSFKQQKGRALTSLDTVNRKAFQPSANIRNTKLKTTRDKNHYDTVLTEEERATVLSTSYSPPSYNLATNSIDNNPLETISSREAQQGTPPPPIPHRSFISSTQRNQNNIDDDSSHYSEITTDTIQSGVSNRSYSKGVLKEASTSHSNKQQMQEEQKQDDDTHVETEEEETEENAHLLKQQPTSLPIDPTANLTVNTSTKTEAQIEYDRIQKRKRLRFRWHLLYTIIKNYHLFDLRKNVQGRLTRLHLQRSNLVNEEQFTATTTVEVPTTAEHIAEPVISTARGHFKRSVSDIPKSINQPPPPSLNRLFSVPVSIISGDYPQSPAEQYIAMSAQMLFDVNNQQSNTPHVPSTAHASIISAHTEQLRPQITTTVSGQSLGFRVSPDVTFHPQSEPRMKSGDKQSNIGSTLQVPGTMISSAFQPASASNQSTADYPLTGTSIVNSSTYRTHMSHDQHMHAWHQEEVKKIQKRHRRTYVYDTPPPTSATSVILTPQSIPTKTIPKQGSSTPNTGTTQRGPTPSPFQFPHPPSQMHSASSSIISDTQSKTKNPKLKKNRPQQGIPIPPQRMDRVDEDPQETLNTNKPPRVTSALVHRKDSQSSVTDITET